LQQKSQSAKKMGDKMCLSPYFCVILYSQTREIENMINRELIRLKTVQITYAYYENGGKNVDVAEKELFFSLSKAYDLYNQMFLMMVAINNIATRSVETQQNRVKRLNEETVISTKFINNRFMAQLEVNEQLMEFRDNQKYSWLDEEDFLRRVYKQITEQEFYNDYMTSGESSFEEDREIWRKIYKNVLSNNDDLDAILEEMSLYWNDDKAIVDTFVLKTIKRFDEANGSKQELLPEFRSEEDKEFASRLFRHAILNADYYRSLISEQLKNWDLNRVAKMDLLIMQIALAEIISFPGIPVSVSINEYVEIAKAYSTPRSGSYINGVLDGIVKRLREENKLMGDK